MFKAALASMGESLDNGVAWAFGGRDDEAEIGSEPVEDVQTESAAVEPIPPPPENDTPRTHARAYMMERERSSRKAKGAPGPVKRVVSVEEDAEEEADAPPTTRERLSAEQVTLSRELFDLFANGHSYFNKDEFKLAFNGWETDQFKFELIDKDGDGKVTLEEWNAFTEKLCAKVSWAGKDGLKTVLLQAKAVVAQHRKSIDVILDERRATMQAGILKKKHYEDSKKQIIGAKYVEGGLTPKQRICAVEIFELMDLDGNGELDREEIISQTGGHDTGMFAEMDADQDGMIKLEEFVLWFKKFRRGVSPQDDEKSVTEAQCRLMKTAKAWAGAKVSKK